MKKNIIILLLLLSYTKKVFSEDNLFYIDNPKNSEFVKNDLFSKLKIDSDEIILLMVSPNTVPRLEILTNLTLENLANRNLDIPYFTFISYPRFSALEDYANSKSYRNNMLLDTSMILFNEYNLNNFPPVLTRWSKEGKLMNYVFIYGVDINDSTMWENFLFKQKEIKKINELLNGYSENDFKFMKYLKNYKEIEIYEDKENYFGILEAPALDNEENFLIATDQLFGKTILFNLKTGKKIKNLELNFEQRKTFSKELNDSLFIRGENRGIANTLFFKSFFDKFNDLYITATLPKVILKVEDNDSLLQYFNEACLVKFIKNKENYVFKNIVKLLINNKDKLGPKHIIAKEYNPQLNEITIPVMKGYPVVGFHKEDIPDDENPITKEFYQDVPLFYTYNLNTGKRTKKLGYLDTINRHYGSGYYFSNANLTYNKYNSFISQHLVPYIEVSDGTKIKLKSYFNNNLTNIPQNNYLDTIPSTSDMDKIFQHSEAAILSISANDSALSVIWKLKEKGKQIQNSEIQIIQKYSLENYNLIAENLIPYKIENYNFVSSYHNQKKNKLICIYQNSKKTKIVYFNI